MCRDRGVCHPCISTICGRVGGGLHCLSVLPSSLTGCQTVCLMARGWPVGVLAQMLRDGAVCLTASLTLSRGWWCLSVHRSIVHEAFVPHVRAVIAGSVSPIVLTVLSLHLPPCSVPSNSPCPPHYPLHLASSCPQPHQDSGPTPCAPAVSPDAAAAEDDELRGPLRAAGTAGGGAASREQSPEAGAAG